MSSYCELLPSEPLPASSEARKIADSYTSNNPQTTSSSTHLRNYRSQRTTFSMYNIIRSLMPFLRTSLPRQFTLCILLFVVVHAAIASPLVPRTVFADDRIEDLALAIVRFPTTGDRPMEAIFPSESRLEKSVSSSENLRLCIYTLCLSPEVNASGKLEIKESTWSQIEATDALTIGWVSFYNKEERDKVVNTVRNHVRTEFKNSFDYVESAIVLLKGLSSKCILEECQGKVIWESYCKARKAGSQNGA
ncbi:hypothetical protein EV368DRAFT_80855 [Lentinula lateritia]|nr:hypothetical protein EV368DRAFT_80855 [Lentinula lateritia]